MLRELKLLFYLFSLIIVVNCNKNKIVIIKGETINLNVTKYYSPDCYIRNKEKEIQINQAFLYKNNKLLKYITPQAEGLVIESINSNSDLKEYRSFRTLIFEELDNEVDLYGKKYMIERKNGDTIFLKKDDIIIIKNPKTL